MLNHNQHLLAIDVSSGTQLWSTPVQFSGDLTNTGDRVAVLARFVFAFDAASGSVIGRTRGELSIQAWSPICTSLGLTFVDEYGAKAYPACP